MRTYNERTVRKELREVAVHQRADFPVVVRVHAAEDVDERDVRRLLLGQLALEREDDVALRRDDVDRDALRVRERDRVVDVLGAPARELRDLRDLRVVLQLAVDDVRRAERLEQGRVVQGRGGDDGREAREAGDLDRWRETVISAIIGLGVGQRCLPYCPTEDEPPKTMKGPL